MKKSTIVLTLALVFASMAGLPAAAGQVAPTDEGDVEAEIVVAIEEDELSVWFDEESGDLIFAVGTDCAPEDDGDEPGALQEAPVETDAELAFTAETDETEDVDDQEGDEDGWSWATPELDLSVCNAISVVGPSGKVNHGSVVAAFVHALKNSEVDGPQGQLVSQIAKSDFGKPEKANKPEKAEKADKPAKVDKPGKPDKPGKSGEKSNNGKAKGKK